MLSPAFDLNPQPYRRRHMETGISDLGGNAASIEAALDAAPFFDVERAAAVVVLSAHGAHHRRTVAGVLPAGMSARER